MSTRRRPAALGCLLLAFTLLGGCAPARGGGDYLHEAAIAFEEGGYEEAALLADKALAQGLDTASEAMAHEIRGDVYARYGDSQSALACYEQGLEAEPEKVSLLLAAARVHIVLENGGEAKRCYEQAIAAEPDNAEAHHLLGRWYRDMEDTKAALASFESAVELQPCNEYYLDYAEALIEEKRLEEAEIALDHVGYNEEDYVRVMALKTEIEHVRNPWLGG